MQAVRTEEAAEGGAVGGTEQRAYIGSFSTGGGLGITVADVDPDTGALTAVHSTDAVENPAFLALSPGGDVLYSVSQTDDGAAVALSLADPARPVPLGAPVPVGGAAPTHLALALGHLLTANYRSGSVSALPIAADGRLGEPVSVLQHEGSGPEPDRQRGPHAHGVHADPSGRWALGVDLGTDSVWVYALDAPGGRPVVHHETRLWAGSGPRHLAFHPRGHRAYVINELDSTLTTCSWDAETGDLTPIGTTPVAPQDTESVNFPSEVAVAADGRFMWVANRGHDSIATLALDESGDAPGLLNTVDCGGRRPWDLALHPSGRHLYTANEGTGDVTWFDIDPSTGAPTRAGSIPVPGASCVILG
ncbi:lactonase family protein [Streptomyces sp. NPDC050610]|uniref:lactonase family protein n=1 Tax=Streptomyces sp. NPDC050610 TaxID=3157097 RepID=UPI0034139D8A